MLLLPLPASTSSTPRRGIVLLVVISMLTLFSVVALSFVFYAQSEANASKNRREGMVSPRADLDPELAMTYFLSQFLYGVPFDQGDDRWLYSGLRGLDLATSTYGWNSSVPNIAPFAGLGREPGNTPESNRVNYTWFRDAVFPIGLPADRKLYDPGRTGTRNNYTDPLGSYNNRDGVGYTYADLSNMFLAQVNADGEILIPSFHRPWSPDGDGIGLNELLKWKATDVSDPYPLGSPGPYSPPPALPNAPPAGFGANLKYLGKTLRPHPDYHKMLDASGRVILDKTFPMPEPGGDVKNLEGVKGVKLAAGLYANNDSIWLDLGFPVLTAPNGMKYKPLFAPLIIDLDGRINLNVAGNIRGNSSSATPPTPRQRSNQGWGPWEMAPHKILTADTTEWENILSYRYNGGTGPALVAMGTGGRTPGFYSRIDWDGVDNVNGAAALMRLPGEGTQPKYATFPDWPSDRYQNGNNTEWGNSPATTPKHPSFFNPFRPNGSNRLLASPYNKGAGKLRMGDLELLLRYGGTNTPALSSDLFRLLPTNITDPRKRRMLTTHSVDLTAASATPWPGSGELAPDGRSSLGTLRKLNLPQLADYPLATAGSVIDWLAASTTVKSDFLKAQQQRQDLARELFNRLRWLVVGTQPGQPLPGAGAPEYQVLRTLAQLAVNIIDYYDSDDISTPFQWDPNDISDAHGYVFGTELPRLVINEVYSDVRNNLDDDPVPGKGRGMGKTKADKDFNIAFWIELLNPLSTDANLSDSGAAWLQRGDTAAYKLLVLDSDRAVNLESPDNVRGTPKQNDIKLEITDYRTDPSMPFTSTDVAVVVNPVNNAYSSAAGDNKGFYVMGPEDALVPTAPKATLQVKEQIIGGARNAMFYSLPNNIPAAALFNKKHTVVLQRLACPQLPHNADPTVAATPYNPYITVDYVEGIPLFDNVELDNNGQHQGKKNYEEMFAVGRKQPYTAHPSKVVPQRPDSNGNVNDGVTPSSNSPQHTFFRHNGIESAAPNAYPSYGPTTNATPQTLDVPFTWLVHLDRPLINTMELLHTSFYAPHLLTQRFQTDATQFGHYTPWFDPNTRLYRLFEHIDAGSKMQGVPSGSLYPGKVNVNTVWNGEIFRAICDANNASSFSGPTGNEDQLVDAVWTQLFQQRTPTGMPGPTDVPFRSLAAPHTGPTGLHQSLLRDATSNAGAGLGAPRLIEVPGAIHPYRKYEMLTKIFNNLTTRSNVFAVWVTVGFFEVTDDTVRPVKLGQEIGKKENRHVRHRMFAIVDRSQLGIANAELTQTSGTTTAGLADIRVQFLSGSKATASSFLPTLPTYNWTIQPGMNLRIGRGTTNDEVVTVVSVDNVNMTFKALCRNPHGNLTAPNDVEKVDLAGHAVVDPGTNAVQDPYILAHPGPQPTFNPRQYPAIVPYFTLIE